MTEAKQKSKAAPASALAGEAVVALIAGGGSLPYEIASRLAEAGRKFLVFLIDGEAEGLERYSQFRTELIELEDIGNLLGRLKGAGATHILMAGTVRRRPRLASIRPGIGMIKAFADVSWALARGDDSLLTAIVKHIEKGGLRVISAQDVLPELLTEKGLIAGPRPTRRDMADIKAASLASKAIGALDIGQATIAVNGRAVALEGIEGTDGLLARMVDLRDHGRLAGAKGGILAKCAKPQQEMRVDLPAIGPETIAAAKRAGLRGIALEAGRSLILERDQTLQRANAERIFIYGLEVADT